MKDWVDEAHDLAEERGLTPMDAVSPEGDAVTLLNSLEPWVHKHECTAVVSQLRGLVAMYCVRWYGSKTLTPRPQQTQWFASLEAALQWVRERYDSEEAIWRLGG
jgi:hypothetical protein